MKEIRLGTIGTGNIVHSILNAVKLTQGISLRAVYSRTEEKGRKLADEYGGAAVYTVLEDMLADPGVNFIYVASPNSLHYGHVKEALLHDKNVICEKPMCAKSAQFKELFDIAKSRRLFLADATPTTFLPNFDILREQLARVGRIRLVIANYSQYSSRYDKLKDGMIPNVFNLRFEGGALQDIGYYIVYLAAALFGRPGDITYFPNICHTKVDTSGIIVMEYPDFICEGAVAKDTRGVNFVQIEGEDGYIYVEDGPNGIAGVKVVVNGREETFNEQPNPAGFDELIHPEYSNRWYYEIQKLTEILLKEDLDGIYKRLDITKDVISLMERARFKAGIHFPG